MTALVHYVGKLPNDCFTFYLFEIKFEEFPHVINMTDGPLLKFYLRVKLQLYKGWVLGTMIDLDFEEAGPIIVEKGVAL